MKYGGSLGLNADELPVQHFLMGCCILYMAGGIIRGYSRARVRVILAQRLVFHHLQFCCLDLPLYCIHEPTELTFVHIIIIDRDGCVCVCVCVCVCSFFGSSTLSPTQVWEVLIIQTNT